jgi:HSP20 family protein
LQDDMNRLFNRRRFGDRFREGEERCPVNVTREPDKIVVELRAPGVDRASIDLTVVEDTVTIKGERKPPAHLAGARCQRRERDMGKFERTVRLGQPLAADQAAASYKDGIIRVELPLAPETRPRKITVSA